jgi:multisubunit Na+/H+ antiporter MnhB subunit
MRDDQNEVRQLPQNQASWDDARSSALTAIAAGLLTMAIAAGFTLGILDLSLPKHGPAPPVVELLDDSGADHPVTAVLLDFRAYDTWLEVVVLVVAVLAVIAARRRPGFESATEPSRSRDPILGILARIVVPFMVLVGGYLLWLGTRDPGGAFQAGAVLSASLVLLRLAHVAPGADRLLEGVPFRALALAGFMAFLVVSAATEMLGRNFLDYPRDWAGSLVLAIEVGVTVSIAVIAAFLFVASRPVQTMLRVNER